MGHKHKHMGHMGSLPPRNPRQNQAGLSGLRLLPGSSHLIRVNNPRKTNPARSWELFLFTTHKNGDKRGKRLPTLGPRTQSDAPALRKSSAICGVFFAAERGWFEKR